MVYPEDSQRLVDMLLACRTATDVRLYPTIWRILLLLTSRVWVPEKDARLWETAAGELAGFAMLWRRRPTSPYLVLDWFSHPAQVSGELLAAMLGWGDRRAQEIVAESNTSLTLYTHAFPSQRPERKEEAAKQSPAQVVVSKAKQSLLAHLNTSGFLPVPPGLEEHNLYFARSLQGVLHAPVLPPGYITRRLHGMADLEAYQAIYGFASVDPRHLLELLTSDEYCCQVIVNPAGEFAAYCECSIWRAEWELAAQRIGWIDYMETKEAEQGKGLGRAVLLAGLAQLQAWGAEKAMLVTINTNVAAVRLYEKSGFERVDVEEPARYEKNIVCPTAVQNG